MIHIFYKTDLIFKAKLNYLLIGIGLFMFFLMGLGFYVGKDHSEPLIVKEIQLIEEVAYVTIPDKEFSPENLKGYIEDLNIKYPHIVYAQALQETGYFTSAIFRENNNLFGMKEPRVRPTTALGTKRNHAYYSNWMNSTKDYALWQASLSQYVYNEEEYFELLSRIYAEDTNYIDRLKAIIGRDDLAMLFNN